jgi:hypothetical protein
VLERLEEVLVERSGLLVLPADLLLRQEPLALILGVGEPGVGRPDLDAGEVRVGVLGERGVVAIRASER